MREDGEDLPLIVYHVAWNSSAVAYDGGWHLNRSITSGFSSIISMWL
jgi:hypothetical protein